MDYSKSLKEQEKLFDQFTAGFLVVWKESESQILRVSTKTEDGTWIGILAELRRLCRRFIHLTPSQIAEAIRDAHRKQLHQEFPKVTILEIENELHLATAKATQPMALPAHSNWHGTPAECLDRNWNEIWAKSVEKSIEKGEKVRAFDWEYLDPYTEEGREDIKRRDRAFGELKRRLAAHHSFDVHRLRYLIRDEMRLHLIAAFPKYIGDIERQVWDIDFDSLDSLSAEIFGKDQSGRDQRFKARPNSMGCERLVCFDLYAEIMGCKWPNLEGKKAPAENKPQMPRKLDIPKSLDDMEV